MSGYDSRYQVSAKEHIQKKHDEPNIKFRESIGYRNSERPIYKHVLHRVWSYGIQL